MTRLSRLNPAVLVLAAAALAALCQLSRARFDQPQGLRGEYFAGDRTAGTPDATAVDDQISTAALAAAWRGTPPPTFTARWFGYLTVLRAGTYSFATTSDDGSSVVIEGQPVVDNGGVHGPTLVTGSIALEPGTYQVLIEYAQRGGGSSIEWTWGRNGSGMGPVPAWRLHPQRLAPIRVLAAHLLQLSSLVLLAAALLLLPFALPGLAPVQRFPRAAALLLFIVMAIVHTWPLATDPGHLSRSDNSDTILNEWILAWVSHQAPRDPIHLFDANIFYPERDTLAYSEAMIAQSALAAPVLWLGGSPVLAYNLVLLAGFALTGWTMALVVARWTGSWPAGLVSGLTFAFNAHTLTRIPHLQAQHGEFLPLAVYALDRLLAEPTVRRALLLALWFTLQSLTSVYMMAFTTVALAVAALVRPDAAAAGRGRRVAVMLATAAGVALLVLLPFLLPYWRLNQEQGLTRSLADAAWYSATWRDYLSTPARLHYHWWSERFFIGTALFPGALGLLLAAVAMISGRALSDRRARMCLAIGVAGVALSFGPSLPGYASLYAVLPLLRAVRATARFGYLGIFAVSALAGFGVVAVQQVFPVRRWSVGATVLVAVAAVEPMAAPLGFTRVGDIPAIYGHLPADAGAVVELPFYTGRAAFQHAPYMLNSTAHWRPLVNGYSGFQPASFHRHVEELAGFPDRRSVETLKQLGVTHVFVHGGALDPARIVPFPELVLVETSGAIALYRLK